MNQLQKIYFLGAVFVLVFLYQFVCSPALKNSAAAKNLLGRKQKDYSELLSLLTAYKKGQGTGSGVRFAPPGFSLFHTVARLLEKNFSKDLIAGITPVTETVSKSKAFTRCQMNAEIKGVSLAAILKFLETVQESPYVSFGSFQLARNPQKSFLVKAEMQFVIYRHNK